MIELKKEQIEAAAKTMYEVLNHRGTEPTGEPYKWEGAQEFVKDHYLRAACAAAPYLQSLWEMPTSEEVILCCHSSTTVCLRKFVERRNAALCLKPVDPRREKIVLALAHFPLRGSDRFMLLREQTGSIADAILAALDEKPDGV